MDKMIKKVIGQMEWDELESMARKTVYELSSCDLMTFMENELKELREGNNEDSSL
jgi:hypothetical protein